MYSIFTRFIATFMVILVVVIIAVPTVSSQDSEDYHGKDLLSDLITSVPRTMTYQGILEDNSGTPLPDSTLDITFRIYDDPNAGSLEWSEIVEVTTDEGGYFTAVLSNLNLPFDEDYYLELEIDGQILDPRQKINMSAYSARSDSCDFAFNSDMLDGFDSGDFALVLHDHDADYVNEGQVNSITGAMIVDEEVDSADIQNGTISFSDIGQNAALNGQVMKWNGSAWVAGNDEMGFGGWTDDGTVVRLETDTDSVGIGTVTPTEKLDVDGNILIRGKAAIGQHNDNSGDAAFVAGAYNKASGDYSVVGGGGGAAASDSNLASGIHSTISGGRSNIASIQYSTVGGGTSNIAGNEGATVGGGGGNTASGGGTAIAGGLYNTASGTVAFVGGGSSNIASGRYAAVCGGQQNTASDTAAVIGGGAENVADSAYVTIGGGYLNFAGGRGATIGGGIQDSATGPLSTVGGGINNIVSASWATVSGGAFNRATGEDATIGGGFGNNASAKRSTVGGGFYNIAGDSSATVGGGQENEATSRHATIGGGLYNTASGNRSTIGGGLSNTSSGGRSTIGGGETNTASQTHATIGGGQNNTAGGISATIAGGEDNQATNSAAAIGGGFDNTASGQYSTISGGRFNTVSANYSGVGSGYNNYATNVAAVISGGRNNRARGQYSFIGGGGGESAADSNLASEGWTVIGGGRSNAAKSEGAVIGGGWWNVADGYEATVGGGSFNQATQDVATVAGGSGNNASSFASAVGGGGSNNAGGRYSTVPGGLHNDALGDYSFAAGRRAIVNHAGTFVWGDSTDADFTSTGVNQFLIRASGGVGIGTNSPGVHAFDVRDTATSLSYQTINFELTTSPLSAHDLLQIEAPGASPDDFQFIECERGTDVEFRVHGDGDVTADGAFTGGGADFAEMVEVSTGYNSVEAGDVMVIDPTNARAIVKSSRSRSTLVAGIYSTEAGFIGSERDWDKQLTDEIGTYTLEDMAMEFNEIPLAVVGIVPCKVSAENGPIRPGDLLVTSNSPGYAMRDDNPKVGTVLGKALESLTSGKDVIKILVTLH